ncbi:MAG: hypothetical protein AAF799_28840 [Myxococcota bacterium]
MDTPSITQNTDTAAVSALAKQFVDAQSKADDALKYVPAAISASVGIESGQAGMRGWITYDEGKIYMSAKDIEHFEGEFGGGGGRPNLPYAALPLHRLAGQVGRFKAEGWGPGGVINVWLDEESVFSLPLPLVGLGHLRPWKVEGTLTFERRD